MKYLTWTIDWSNPKEGTQPSNINNDDTSLTSVFYAGEITAHGTKVYGYLVKGNLDFSELTNWEVEEISADDFLLAAKTHVSSSCTFDSNGMLDYPYIPIPTV